jgi:hypothetical protein
MRRLILGLTIACGLTFAACAKRGSNAPAGDTSAMSDSMLIRSDSGPVPRFPRTPPSTDTAAGQK